MTAARRIVAVAAVLWAAAVVLEVVRGLAVDQGPAWPEDDPQPRELTWEDLSGTYVASARRCVTHHNACDCRQAGYDELRDAAFAVVDRLRCCAACDGSGDDPALDRLLTALGLIEVPRG
jgi:hypothetical protein